MDEDSFLPLLCDFRAIHSFPAMRLESHECAMNEMVRLREALSLSVEPSPFPWDEPPWRRRVGEARLVLLCLRSRDLRIQDSGGAELWRENDQQAFGRHTWYIAIERE